MAGTIFICYRRGPDTPSAGWLHSLLVQRAFAPEQVFRDVDGIEPGEDFVEILEAQVDACDVLLCMIGPGWLDTVDRLGEPGDYVRIEIAAALAKGKRVIPLLLDQARMPSADALPAEIRTMTRRHAAWLRHDHFAPDLLTLIPILQKAIKAVRADKPDALQSQPPQPTTSYRDIDAPWCPEMVAVPAGSFMMGSPETEAGRSNDEGPQHRVTISHPFAIGKFPVMFAEYDHYCESTAGKKPEDQGWGRGRRPVINVSWDDAKAFVKWLAAETGKPYRLPSEAEWEYAGRAGTTTPFCFGDEISGKEANISQTIGKTTEVGSYRPNAWGLYDMHGNVWEWVEDCWHKSYEGAPEDGSAWLKPGGGDCGFRVLRGGSWNFTQDFARAAGRGGDAPSARYDFFGFRVVCSSPSFDH